MTTPDFHAPVQRLYATRSYPDMSHPVADPAVTAVAARLGGLACPSPARARILEIGCAGGHHLIPLAQRWPDSHFTGIDFASGAVATARRRAAASNLANVSFHEADVRNYQPDDDGGFDFIIAHGFFSWVPDDVKSALLAFCQRNLAPLGIATVSFNLQSGWARRQPLIDLVRTLQEAHGWDEIMALSFLRDLVPADSGDPQAAATRWIIDDMLAKGPDILAFDDFGPVNDPWPLDRFLAAINHHGLAWLGESDPAQNLPSVLDDDARQGLAAFASDPLTLQLAADFVTGRTFRSGVLRRADAPVQGGFASGMVLEFALRAGKSPPPPDHPGAELFRALAAVSPLCVTAADLADDLPPLGQPQLARLVFEGITRGFILPRIEPVRFAPQPPERPSLDPFRLLCARERLPLVDAFHVPCSFPAAHYQVLAAMDGDRTCGQLAGLARERCPDLDFVPWLRHLASRGLFHQPPLTSSR